MEKIISKNNPLIKSFIKLKLKKHREKNKLFIVEGEHLVNEAIAFGNVKYVLSSKPNDNAWLVSQTIIDFLSSTKSPQHIIAICNFLKPCLELKNKVLVLDEISDPGNLGTLIRTAVAFGMTDILVKGVDIYNPKVLRSSQGAIFRINILRITNIEPYLKTNRYLKIGTIIDKKALKMNDLTIEKPYMLILGNEARGINEKTIHFIDYKVYIPISFESLNVAIAGAILMNYFNN